MIVYSKVCFKYFTSSLIGDPRPQNLFLRHIEHTIWSLIFLFRSIKGIFASLAAWMATPWGLLALYGQCNGWPNICLSGLGKTVNLLGNISSEQ